MCVRLTIPGGTGIHTMISREIFGVAGIQIGV